MEKIDWSVLSGPNVSRRTMMKLAAATGAFSFANWLAACGEDDDADDEGVSAPTTEGGAAAETPETGGAETTPGAGGAEAETTPGGSPAAVAEGTTAPTGGQQGKQGGTATYGFHIGQIQTLDPAQVNLGAVAGELLANLFSGLVQFDADLNLVPDLAEDWEVSEDGTSYTFHLRDGLTFHNGDPLTAEDVVFTFNRTTDPELASPHSNKLELVTNIEAADETTVNLTLSEPFAPFLAVACSRGPGRALQPVPQNAIDEMGDEQFGLTPVGSGPFMIVPETVEVGKGFEMVAFENWYGGRPLLDKVVVRLIPDPTSRVSAFQAGDIDFLGQVPTAGFEQVSGMENAQIVETPGTNWIGLTMNYKRPPWDKPEARLAVAKAINNEEFIEKALFGLAIPAHSAVAPAFGWVYRPEEEVADNPQAFNLDEAKQLAEQAGLQGLQPAILSSAEDPRPEQVLRNMLSEIGLDLQIDQVQTAAYNERWLAGEYDMNVNGSVVDADPDDGHWNFFYSQGPWNSYGYTNAEADQILEATRTTADQEQRAELYRQLEDILRQDVAYVFLYHTPDRTAFYNYIQGYVPIPEQRYLEHVWLDK